MFAVEPVCCLKHIQEKWQSNWASFFQITTPNRIIGSLTISQALHKHGSAKCKNSTVDFFLQLLQVITIPWGLKEVSCSRNERSDILAM